MPATRHLDGFVLQRTPLRTPVSYIRRMAMKPFSYLMIGAFASGLVMTVLGAFGVLTGL